MQLVYLSPVPWSSFAQRPHKFVEWFHAKCGGSVLWIDPYPTRLPVLDDFRQVKTRIEIAAEPATNMDAPGWLAVLSPRSLPIEPLPGSGIINRLLWNDILQVIGTFVEEGECLLGVGKPSKLALQVLARYPAVPSFYDAMDYFPAFYQGISRVAMERSEREVTSRVSRILASSTALGDRFSSSSSKLSLVLNACSTDTLPPINVTTKSSERQILGYVGTIGHWFDWRLVFFLAESNPSMTIRLIGPLHTKPPVPVPANIGLLPACDHESAIRAMQEFSLGLIPFKRIDLTASVDPIKYYEYRALGLPILSTRFGEMALRDGQAGVFIVDEYSDLANQMNMALAYECEMDDMRKFREDNCWEARFDASGILH